LCSITLIFRKSCLLCDNVEKYCKTGKATEDNKVRHMRTACWIPKVYRHTLRICNSYCFPTATMFTLRRLNFCVTRKLPALLSFKSGGKGKDFPLQARCGPEGG
jgi:hypothetical protein